MAEDLLDLVQGRWQTGEGDFVVVEADQVWFLGETTIYGNLVVDTKDGENVVLFNPVDTADGAAPVTAKFAEGDTKLIWEDGDMWKKLQPGETPSANVTSGKGTFVGTLGQGSTLELDEEGQERRWTKNGQLGSRADM